jgi:hypothetical protein
LIDFVLNGHLRKWVPDALVFWTRQTRDARIPRFLNPGTVKIRDEKVEIE